jgi:hypothetical protein
MAALVRLTELLTDGADVDQILARRDVKDS